MVNKDPNRARQEKSFSVKVRDATRWISGSSRPSRWLAAAASRARFQHMHENRDSSARLLARCAVVALWCVLLCSRALQANKGQSCRPLSAGPYYPVINETPQGMYGIADSQRRRHVCRVNLPGLNPQLQPCHAGSASWLLAWHQAGISVSIVCRAADWGNCRLIQSRSMACHRGTRLHPMPIMQR